MSTDRYEIVRQIGSGHFTEGVYLARHKDLDRDVALKLLKIEATETRQGLLSEARKMAALRPNDYVVQVHDAGDWDSDTVYIASELCVEGSLETMVNKTPLGVAYSCSLISAVCRGLVSMHSEGLLHLDIRPANILLSNGMPKLCDFGLSRWISNAQVPTIYVNHAAPEMMSYYSGSAESDQYALAMTLAHVLSQGSVCSVSPPDPPSAKEWKNWRPLDRLGANVPKALTKSLAIATSYDSTDRYDSIEHFKRAIDLAIPLVSFLPPFGNAMQSEDGDWEIRWLNHKTGWQLEVRKGGRRLNRLGQEKLSDKELKKQLAKTVSSFSKCLP